MEGKQISNTNSKEKGLPTGVSDNPISDRNFTVNQKKKEFALVGNKFTSSATSSNFEPSWKAKLRTDQSGSSTQTTTRSSDGNLVGSSSNDNSADFDNDLIREKSKSTGSLNSSMNKKELKKSLQTIPNSTSAEISFTEKSVDAKPNITVSSTTSSSSSGSSTIQITTNVINRTKIAHAKKSPSSPSTGKRRAEGFIATNSAFNSAGNNSETSHKNKDSMNGNSRDRSNSLESNRGIPKSQKQSNSSTTSERRRSSKTMRTEKKSDSKDDETSTSSVTNTNGLSDDNVQTNGTGTRKSHPKIHVGHKSGTTTVFVKSKSKVDVDDSHGVHSGEIKKNSNNPLIEQQFNRDGQKDAPSHNKSKTASTHTKTATPSSSPITSQETTQGSDTVTKLGVSTAQNRRRSRSNSQKAKTFGINITTTNTAYSTNTKGENRPKVGSVFPSDNIKSTSNAPSETIATDPRDTSSFSDNLSNFSKVNAIENRSTSKRISGPNISITTKASSNLATKFGSASSSSNGPITTTTTIATSQHTGKTFSRVNNAKNDSQPDNMEKKSMEIKAETARNPMNNVDDSCSNTTAPHPSTIANANRSISNDFKHPVKKEDTVSTKLGKFNTSNHGSTSSNQGQKGNLNSIEKHATEIVPIKIDSENSKEIRKSQDALNITPAVKSWKSSTTSGVTNPQNASQTNTPESAPTTSASSKTITAASSKYGAKSFNIKPSSVESKLINPSGKETVEPTLPSKSIPGIGKIETTTASLRSGINKATNKDESMENKTVDTSVPAWKRKQ